MLQLPPHGFGQSSAHSAIHRSTHNAIQKFATVTLWNQKLLLLAMGMSAILLLADRNSKALAEARSAAQDLPPTRRPGRSEPQGSNRQTLWVNPQTGNDANADGSEQAPFRSLTWALQAARPQSVIQLAAGTYSSDSGEQFPILLKPDVTVQGNPDDLGQAVVIRGGGSYSSQSQGRQMVTLVGVNQAVLTGVTVTNPAVRGYGLWVEAGIPTVQSSTFTGSNTGLIAVGSSAPVIKNNLFMLNRSGLQIAGDARPQVHQNIFQRTGTGITIGETAAGQLVGNRISQNRDGVVIQDKARPILRGNQIEDSERDGIVVTAQAQPDLGTRRDPGQNQFLNSQQHDVNASTSQTLSAVGNQITGQLAGNLDLTGQHERIASTPTPRTELIASLPPVSANPALGGNVVSNKAATATPVGSAPRQISRSIIRSAPTATQPTYQTIAFNASTPPVNISVPPPQRVSALAAGLQPASSAKPTALVTNPPARSSARSSAPAPSQPPALGNVLGNVIVTTAASLPRQTFAAVNTPILSGSPINIPAPPAESLPKASQPNASQPNRQPATNSALLPVPSGEIPVGNTGDMTRVSVAAASSRASLWGSQAQSLQYRVLVADTDEQVQNQVQALVPDAFSTQLQGQSALQIGAFSSYENAQEAVQILSQNGLRGIIQPVE
jgi:parallel beta-helix repeat protein